MCEEGVCDVCEEGVCDVCEEGVCDVCEEGVCDVCEEMCRHTLINRPMFEWNYSSLFLFSFAFLSPHDIYVV